MRTQPSRARNDLGQYDDLAGEWWRPGGAFAMLHWLAEARGRLVPPAARPGAVLLDLGCGAGLLAPHVAGKGYRHVGVDLVGSALEQAAAHGVEAVRADVTRLPVADASVDVVSAGEVLEHVRDWRPAVREACRVLRPGGVLVLDTLADTLLCRIVAVHLAERVPAAPRGIHDPELFVDPAELVRECARNGVTLRTRGIRPQVWPMLRWALAGRVGRVGERGPVSMVPTFSRAVLYQGRGVKEGAMCVS